MKPIALAAAFAILCSSASLHASAAGPAVLTLEFDPAATTGTVMVSLFDSESTYLSGKPIRQATVKIADGERSAVFADLQPGKYAAKAFHDVNGDGKMNLNPFGLPVEPVAFSNNAPANMGPARWERAQLMVSGNTAQTIVIR